VYCLNDMADITNDLNHPHKRNRPFAAGRLSVLTGWLIWPLLAALALITAWAVNGRFFVALGSYLVLTTAYTFRWKQIPVLDVVSLGLLYTIRIIAGAAAILAPLSMWLLTFSMLLFLSLALVKRVSELTRARAELKATKGRGYRDTDLELLASYGVATSIGAVVIFSLYVNDPATAELYRTPEVLWASVPVLLAWLMRCWLIAHRGEMNEDPIVFAIRDWVSLLAGVLIGTAFIVAATGLR
jgi:4-hydroxybenzoate polyprenyltransferase